MSTPLNTQTKMWPIEKPAKNVSTFETVSSGSKQNHKHKHHHHRHHHRSDKHRRHHHHHHHSRQNRAKSAEAIRNRPNQTLASASKIITTNPQYNEQDQQQSQQPQQMIIYREVPNGEGYAVDQNGLATVPYETQNETGVVDDQQAPFFVYRDGNFQPQTQSIVTDGIPQQVFYSQDHDGVSSC